MLPPLIQRPRQSAVRRRERGVTLALVAVAIFSIIAMAGLSIDVGTLYEASAEAQRAADSGALAAARIISMSGITGDPTNSTDSWQQICKDTASPATAAAIAVVQQNLIAGAAASSTNVTYSAGSTGGTGFTDCSSLAGTSFGLNPVVTVKVTQSSLPTYFSRIWGRRGSSVSATATAEAFNPSNSGTYASGGAVVPVQPRCVKPWIVPNYDPLTTTGPWCTTTGCTHFVDASSGSIKRPGILPDGSGVIGETFWLVANCHYGGSTCTFRSPQPQANIPNPGGGNPHIPTTPNLEYLPGQTSYVSGAVPSNSSSACSAVASAGNYAQAIAGCDQSTQYQCGVAGANQLDFNENPGAADTTNGAQCLIHQTSNNVTNSASGQDTLLPFPSNQNYPFGPNPNYPFQIQVGSNNPLLGAGVSSTHLITSSTSIVSLPIYDSSTVVNQSGPSNVTIIGFLQVFINAVDKYGNVSVTVMNVSGCGNSASGAAEVGTSPVPIRLITPP